VEDQQEKEKRKGNDIFGGETLYPHININVLPSHPVTELERSVRSRPNKVSVSVVYGRGDHQVWNTRWGIGDQHFWECLSGRRGGLASVRFCWETDAVLGDYMKCWLNGH
jgi:hypothetical protein